MTANPDPFPRITEIFEDDRPALQSFVAILQRELRQAADDFARAFAAQDITAVGDLKHKLKTSLRLLEANELRDHIATVTTRMRAGGRVSQTDQQRIASELRDQAEQLEVLSA